MLASVFRPRQGERAFFLFFTLPWASGLLSPPRGRDFVCSYLSSLFAFGQAKRNQIVHFVKLGIRFSNLRNFFLLRAMGDSMRLHICASEYNSKYLSGANIQSSMPDIVDILWFEMKDSSSLAGTKAVFLTGRCFSHRQCSDCFEPLYCINAL